MSHLFAIDTHGLTLLAPPWLHWGWTALGLLLIGLISVWVRRRALAAFWSRAQTRTWATKAAVRAPIIATTLCCLAILAVCLALARPANNPKPQTVERMGRDVVFVVDVSRSMLAEDLKPSRLARAKLAMNDVLDVVEGDRVSVVAFAGLSLVKCPLTTDYAFARMTIDNLSPDSVSRGGTAIGDAIRTAVAELVTDPTNPKSKKPPSRSRTIFLFTDGEDHESFPVEAAEAAGAKGIRIVAIGLGSDLKGAPVPAENAGGAYMSYQGAQVESKMDASTLQKVAKATPGGVFLNVGTGNIELDQVYKQLMKNTHAAKLDTEQAVRYTELFQWPLGLAIGLLLMEGLVYARSR